MGQPRTNAKETNLIWWFQIGKWNLHGILKNILTKFDHGKNTRGNRSLVVLSKVRCGSGRKAFAFPGASMYNNPIK